MPRGPQHQRLADYVEHANPDGLDEASTQWWTGMNLLRQVSRELDSKAQGMKNAEGYSDGAVWSGATASTARDAFAKSSQAMHDKADEMQKGSQAFTDAATGVRDARHRLAQLDRRDPGELPAKPQFSPGPRTPADETKQSRYDTAVTTYWRDYHANETDAAAAITDLQDNHETQAGVFQGIHGEKKVSPKVHDPSGPAGTATRPVTTHVPGGGHVVGHGPDDVPGGHDHPNPTTRTRPTRGRTTRARTAPTTGRRAPPGRAARPDRRRRRTPAPVRVRRRVRSGRSAAGPRRTAGSARSAVWALPVAVRSAGWRLRGWPAGSQVV